jgi:hypothetical protein
LFDEIGGAVVSAETVAQGEKGVFVFPRHDLELAGETVVAAVLRGNGFAFGSLRPGGELGVGAVGVDLRLRGGFFLRLDGFRERIGLILQASILAGLLTGLVLSGTALFSVEHLLFL